VSMNPIASVRFRLRRGAELWDPVDAGRRRGAEVGDDVRLPRGTVLTDRIRIGDHTWFSGRPSFEGDGEVTFGRWVAVGSELRVISSNHGLTQANIHYGLFDFLSLPRNTDVGHLMPAGSETV
jgi:acetyltransferase-like isoleucine patch superfamily enzyme